MTEPKDFNKKSLTLRHTTEAGKELHLVTHAGSANKVFQWKDGGVIPFELTGLFTDDTAADQALIRWKAKKPAPTLKPHDEEVQTIGSSEIPDVSEPKEEKGFLSSLVGN
jgi:hypothetical protein